MKGACIWMVVVGMLVARIQAVEIDVKKAGAKGDGASDDSGVIVKAWEEACKGVGPGKIVIPAGKYMVGPMKFTGPCQGPSVIQALGAEFLAPVDPNQLKGQANWVTFDSINEFQLLGGIFNGQGKTGWSVNDWHGADCLKSNKCAALAINLGFIKITNSVLQGVKSVDSKQFHMNLLHCKNLTVTGASIQAPAESKNTDGIHIGRSSDVRITDTVIQTGDDCVSLGDGSQQITIEKVQCGPGHGLAVGSLGKYNNEEDVSGVTVKNCTLTNTMYGCRVKTWPHSAKPGVAKDMHFEDIIMNNVSNPIYIDQEYCPHNQCDLSIPSSIKLSDISFKNIRGTSATKVAIKLQCSKGAPCDNVQLSDINLEYHGPNGTAISECGNIKPVLTGKLFPPVAAA